MTSDDRLRIAKEIIADVYSARPDRDVSVTADAMSDDVLLFDYEGTGAASLELDSLDALEIAASLEEHFGVVFPSDLDPARIATPARMMTYIDELVGQVV